MLISFDMTDVKNCIQYKSCIDSQLNKSPNMYTLIKVDEKYCQEALELLAETIVNPRYGEPMSKILKTSKSTFKQVYRSEVSIGCSLGFSYGYLHEGKLISVVIAMPYNTYISLPKHSVVEEGQIAPKKALHQRIHQEYLPPKPEKTLFMVWGSVLVDHFKNGMYEKLSLIVEEIGRKEGFQYSMGIASNISSQNISTKKLCYQPVYRLKYADFEFKGQKVFQNIQTTQFIIVGLKKLSPQPNM